jgi:hypothetical protein
MKARRSAELIMLGVYSMLFGAMWIMFASSFQ